MRVESGMRVADRPACAIKLRTFAAPVARRQISVAVLSLWQIIASSATRAGASPLRAPNTGLTSARTLSSTGSIVSSDRLPSSVACKNRVRMKVLTALPTKSGRSGAWAMRHVAPCRSPSIRQLVSPEAR